jgi:hypothetical protein
MASIKSLERMKELYDISRANGSPGPKGIRGPEGIKYPKGWVKKKEEKNKNMDIINILVDAVVASGKKFSEIPKESIYAYLDKAGINKSKWQSIYDTLAGNFKETKETVKIVEEDRRPKNIVDYTKVSTQNDVKQRQPRKSIFSEIKKLT